MVSPYEIKETGEKFEPEILEDAKRLEKTDDVSTLDDPIAKEVQASFEESATETSTYESNETYEIDDKRVETDNNGKVFKEDDKLVANNKYEAGDSGAEYETDSNGRIVTYKADLELTPESERDLNAQREAGGADRLEKDDGGHLIARILGGASGIENLVAMRDTINRSDYKSFENSCVNDLKDGHDVSLKGTVEYNGDSERPSEIKVEKYVEGKKTTEATFYNDAGSTEGLSEAKETISKEDYESLKSRVDTMKEYDAEPTITSVTKKYDENGNVSEVTVKLRDETTGRGTVINYSAR